MNPHIKAMGETVLRVRNLDAVKKFYTDVIGLDVLREFEGITFLKVASGHGGHTQIVGLFQASLPDPFGLRREPVEPRATIYVKDPEGNVVELVCFDESVQ